MNIQNTKRKGFTLIELLIVIAIIGLLSSVVLASLSSARAKAFDVKRVADKNQVRTAMQMYYTDNSTFPNTSGGWRCLGAPSTESCWNGGYAGLDSLNTAIQPYLPSIPKQPADAGTYAYQRFLYIYPATIAGQTGAFLIWAKEATMAASDCPSATLPQHYDKYWYCYEYLGN